MGSSGGKGKSGSIEVTFYYLSMHIGIALYGAGLKFLGIKFGDKYALRTELPSAGGGRAALINRQDLFGGPKKEGGVEGKLWWLDGNPSQVMPEELASKLGRTSATCPGFRGLSSIFLTEPDAITAALPAVTPSTAAPFWRIGSLDSGRPQKGFNVGANNPYLKDVAVRLRRPSAGLNQAYAMIQIADDSEGNTQFASNAAHMIYECMTDADFGMGEDPAAFNLAQWEAQAVTLFNENFGLNILWTRQSSIEAFVKEIIDHIQAKIDINPESGLYELILLRGDYDINTLPELNPNNAVFSNFRMKSWSSVTNEIVVTWTNPETGKNETVTAQDPAAIALQGGVTSDTRNYYAIADSDLAMAVAERDLAIAAHPIPTLEAEVTLEFWLTTISKVFKVSWPKRGIQAAYFRVSKVERGTKSRTVKLSLYEDVFALGKANYLGGVSSQWSSTAQDPAPLVYYKLGTAPAFFTVTALGLSDIGELPYPECLSAVIAAPDSSDDIGYELYGSTTTVTGQPATESYGEMPLRASWNLAAALSSQAVSSIAIPASFYGVQPAVGDFVMLGNGPDATNEFGVILSITDGVMQVSRGVLDTVPLPWATGNRLWIIPSRTVSGDPTRRSAFETATYRLLTMTSRGKLPYASATALDVTLSERPHLPLRPANVKIGAAGFGPVAVSLVANPVVTWANRNRIVEATQILQWTEATTTPEVGQTTRIYILHPVTRNSVHLVSGITGTTHTLLAANFAGLTSALVRVVSVRDGMESLQGHEILVNRA